MRYDISKPIPPAMPKLGKGTECIKLLLSQASESMHEPLVPMFFPILGAHISGTEFMYPDNSWKEPTGMMANLVAHSGDNKGQLGDLAEAICRGCRYHITTARAGSWASRTATSFVAPYPASGFRKAPSAASTTCRY